MNINTIKSVYFIGAGGIGMSALVRYFLSKGKEGAGYDRTQSELTEELIKEGANIHYEENISLIPDSCKIKKELCTKIMQSSQSSTPYQFFLPISSFQ